MHLLKNELPNANGIEYLNEKRKRIIYVMDEIVCKLYM